MRIEPRGTRRTDATYLVDVRLEKTIRLRGSRSVGIYADVFNLTNRGLPLVPSVVEASSATFGEPTQWGDTAHTAGGGPVPLLTSAVDS